MKRCAQCMRSVPADAIKCPSCGVTFPTNDAQPDHLHDPTEPRIAGPLGTLVDSRRADTSASTHVSDVSATHQDVTEHGDSSDDVFTSERKESDSELSAIDERVLRAIDGARSLDELAVASGIGRAALQRVIERLRDRGLVLIDRGVPRSAQVATIVDSGTDDSSR